MTDASTAAAVQHIVVMGVSGCGKTTIGALVAHELGLPFADGDSLHPVENIAKMAAGTPLNDDDRAPWLGPSAGSWPAPPTASSWPAQR